MIFKIYFVPTFIMTNAATEEKEKQWHWSKRKKEKEHNMNQHRTSVLLANPNQNLLTHAILTFVVTMYYN